MPPAPGSTASVWAVVPVHDGVEHTLAFLASMRRQSYTNVRVVLVDDGSTDGTAGRVNEAFPDVEILAGDGSLWWSGATNRGVLHALSQGADFVLTINNDLELDPGAVGALVAAAATRPRALIGAKVCSDAPPHEDVFFGESFGGGTVAVPGSGSDEQLRSSDWLIGMGVLVPARAFADVGLYDEVRFPQYYGDSDFSLRAKEQGYELLVCGQAVLYSDVESNWLARQRRDPHLRFYWDVFFSTRSLFHVGISYRYHRRHHPDPSVRTWVRTYWVAVRGALASVAYHYVRKRLRRAA